MPEDYTTQDCQALVQDVYGLSWAQELEEKANRTELQQQLQSHATSLQHQLDLCNERLKGQERVGQVCMDGQIRTEQMLAKEEQRQKVCQRKANSLQEKTQQKRQETSQCRMIGHGNIEKTKSLNKNYLQCQNTLVAERNEKASMNFQHTIDLTTCQVEKDQMKRRLSTQENGFTHKLDALHNTTKELKGFDV